MNLYIRRGGCKDTSMPAGRSPKSSFFWCKFYKGGNQLQKKQEALTKKLPLNVTQPSEKFFDNSDGTPHNEDNKEENREKSSKNKAPDKNMDKPRNNDSTGYNNQYKPTPHYIKKYWVRQNSYNPNSEYKESCICCRHCLIN